MQIFDPVPRGNAAGSQMMSYSHAEKDLNRNEHLNLKFEEKKSKLTAAYFFQNNFYFSQNKLRS